MNIGSIGSSNYYLGQVPAMQGRSGFGSKSGPMAAEGANGNRMDPVEIFNKMDLDSSGGLDQSEFQTLADKIAEVTGQAVDVAELFTTYDENGDGVLDEEETGAALEANRPQGPRQEGKTSESESPGPGLPAGIERYMQAAAMGLAKDETNNRFAMLGSTDNGNALSSGWINPVNTWT